MREEEKIPRKEVVRYYKFQINTTDALINIKKSVISIFFFFFPKVFFTNFRPQVPHSPKGTPQKYRSHKIKIFHRVMMQIMS